MHFECTQYAQGSLHNQCNFSRLGCPKKKEAAITPFEVRPLNQTLFGTTTYNYYVIMCAVVK